MRLALLRITIVIICLVFLSDHLSAQNCFNTGLNGMVINLPCNQNCVNIPVQIPHLKSSSDYKLVPVPYNPFPYTTTTGAQDPAIYVDDFYSHTIDMPFPFCFYDSLFSKVVVGSNGLITFDWQTNGSGSCSNAFHVNPPLPFGGTASCSQFAQWYYPRSSIMGCYSDLNPATSPPERKIQWDVFGTAPCRKFVISYFHVNAFNCPNTPNTFQIVLYESTGLIDIYFEQKLFCTTSSDGGIGIMGIQDWTPSKYVVHPARNATQWTASNEGWRFVPSGGASRFVSCEVQTLSGTFIATGDTVTTTPGVLDVTFPSFCPAGASGQYVVKTTFSACDNPANSIISYDTITINKTSSLNATAAVTSTNCGVSGSGTATITVPAGIGTAPYTFLLNPGNITLTGNSPQQFTGLNAGNYTVTVSDAGGSCSNTIPVTITSTGVLSVSFNITNTSCFGDSVKNGAIIVTPPNGTPPITYTIIHPSLPVYSIIQVGNGNFPSMLAGDYFLTVQDNAGCQANNLPFTIAAGPSITMATAATPTSCPGANNGTITITGSNGTPPFLYSINGGPIQPSNTFTNLAPGTYFVSMQDAVKCQVKFSPVTVDQGVGTLAGTAVSTATSCSGATNGTITVTPTTGSGPYQYSLNNGPYQSSNVFTGLAAGNYNVIIKEAGLCTSNQIPVTVNPGSALAATVAPAATSCNGSADGTVTVTPTNGSAPYQYSLDAGPLQANNTFGGLTFGPHTVIVKDVAGCISAPIPFNILAGPSLTGTATSTATACTGVNNGTITATATNSTGPYQYSLDGGAYQAGNTFINVSAGPHSITIKNALGCTSAGISVTVAVGSVVTATITTTATACVGVNNGSITVTPTNGSAPYQYSLDNGPYQTSNVITGISAGVHNVVVKDNFGCISNPIPTTIVAGAALTASTTSTATACAGVNNGSITVTPTNGSAPYQYSLDNGPYQANNIITGVSSGVHNVVFRDNFGCVSNPIQVTVAAGSVLTATTTTTATACADVNTGSITVTPTNGGSPYQYSLDGGANQASNIFTGVSAGPHNVIVSDNFGCISPPIGITIATAPALTGTAISTATSCNGASNGTITTTATNGTGPYQYSLDGGAYQVNNIFSGVTSGPHSVVIRDNFGCVSGGVPITVAAGNALNATANAISTSCSGASNGSINVTAPTNGTTPYQYSINANPPQPGATFNSLAAATYTINVTDGGGCSSGNISVTVNPGPAISETLNKTDATCFGSFTGSIIAAPSANATAPLQYSLNNTTWQASPNFNGLAAGSYTVYIRDAVGCSNSAAITIGQPAQLMAATSAQGALCNSANNGLIIVNATGGVPAYSYSLNNINYQAGNTFNVVAGSYTVYVKDANNCPAPVITNVIVTQPAALTATAITGNATCDGGNDGTITVTPAGGTLSYQYATTGIPFQASNILNVGPGTYIVNIKDANGCPVNIPGVVVGLTSNLTLTPAIDPAPICEGNSVKLQTVTNATQFAWVPATNLSDATIADPIANPAIPTLYTLTATLGRCSTTDDVWVTVIPAPIPYAGPPPPGDICFGKTYQLQGSGGVNYTWTPSAYLNDANIPDPIVTPDKTTTYTLSVTDANGCSSLVTDKVTVTVTPPIKVTTYPVDTIVYAGAQIPLLATSVGTYYTWSTPAGLNNPNIANPIATAPLVDGSIVTYQVRAFTAGGCQGVGYVKIEVYKGPDIYMVNAFSPNNDGKNEKFIPFPVGIKQLNYFQVLNRWGQVLFSTKTLSEGWDGRFGGVEQPNGVYVWMVQGVTWDNKIITKKGTVTLIR